MIILSYDIKEGMGFILTPEFDFVNENSKSREASLFNHLSISGKFNEDCYAAALITLTLHRVNTVCFVLLYKS